VYRDLIEKYASYEAAALRRTADSAE
jgi:hypothetical protein